MTVRIANAVCLLVIASCIPAAGSGAKYRLVVSVSQSRAEPGQTVSVGISRVQTSRDPVHAVMLKPSAGTESLLLHAIPNRRGSYSTSIVLPREAAQGLYVIRAWAGNEEHPSAIGKATFLLGRLVGDFLIVSALDRTDPAGDLNSYLEDFRSVGGNFLIAHNLITPDRAYFHCSVCKHGLEPDQEDVVELLLSQADKLGYAVLLSVSWDLTQEGSGTYYVPYIREFSQYAKALDRNLLVACAPYVDDPLLAGYLSTLDSLDIIIWQSGVMGSYRPDNRKQYPLRRVKDFCSLA